MSRRIMLRIFTLLMVCFLHISYSFGQEVVVGSHAVSCNGSIDGEVTANVSGFAYEYSLRLVHASNNKLIKQYQFNADTSISFQNLEALEYIIQVVSLGKLIEKPIKVESPDVLNAVVEITKHPTSQESCDGEIKIIAKGGIPPYKFKWSENTGNSEHEYLTNLCAGIYRCFVQDKSRCNDTDATVFLTKSEKNN